MVAPWKPVFAALVIFAAGMATGALIMKVNLRPSQPRPWAAWGGGYKQGFKEGAGFHGSMQNNGKPDREKFSPRREPNLDGLLKRMSRDLNLTPEQRTRIEGLLQESQARMKTIWEQMPSEFKAMRDKIQAELTPEQQRKFEDVFKQKDDWKPGRSGPPGENPSRKQGKERGRPGKPGAAPGEAPEGNPPANSPL